MSLSEKNPPTRKEVMYPSKALDSSGAAHATPPTPREVSQSGERAEAAIVLLATCS